MTSCASYPSANRQACRSRVLLSFWRVILSSRVARQCLAAFRSVGSSFGGHLTQKLINDANNVGNGIPVAHRGHIGFAHSRDAGNLDNLSPAITHPDSVFLATSSIPESQRCLSNLVHLFHKLSLKGFAFGGRGFANRHRHLVERQSVAVQILIPNLAGFFFRFAVVPVHKALSRAGFNSVIYHRFKSECFHASTIPNCWVLSTPK